MRRCSFVIVPLLLLLVPSAHASVTRDQAAQAAVRALRLPATQPVIVFRYPSPVVAGTSITESGRPIPVPVVAPATSGPDDDRTPTPAPDDARPAPDLSGLHPVSAPIVLRVAGEPAWMFYADLAPHAQFAHPGRVVLVGVRSGHVRVSRTLEYGPIVDGQSPPFLRSTSAYLARANRVLYRPLRAARGASVPGESAAVVPDATTEQRLADLLGTQRTCVVVVADTAGSTHDASGTGRGADAVVRAFQALAARNANIVVARYDVRSRVTANTFTARLVATSGCRDVLFYAAGSATADGDAGLVTATQARGAQLVVQDLRAAQLQALLTSLPHVRFTFVLEAPQAARIRAVLGSAPNLHGLLAPGASQGASLAHLPELLYGRRLVRNGGNPERLPEFTNTLLRGLRVVASSPAEGARLAAQADGPTGGSVSAVAQLLGRAWSLAPAGLGTRVAGYSPAVVEVRPAPPVPPVPPFTNSAPVVDAASASTAEDAPVDVALRARDADGDPLVAQVVDAPAHGAVTVSGTTVTYAPAHDFNGGDSFRVRVVDLRGAASASVEVAVAVTPVDDAPRATNIAASTDEDAPVVVPRADVLGSGIDADGETVRIDRLEGSSTLSGTTAAGAVVSIAADGSITYDPNGLFEALGAGVERSDSFTYRIVDTAGSSVTAVATIAVHGVDDAPVVDAGVGIGVHVEDGTPTLVTPLLTVADVDSGVLARATVAITGGLDAGSDVLDAASYPGLSTAWDSTAATLTFTGSASVADYQAALRSVTFAVTSDMPSTTTRTIAVSVDDGLRTSTGATRDMDVTATDDAPRITGYDTAGTPTADTPEFTEGGAPVQIDPTITVTDPDSPAISGATVAIGSNLDIAHDDLSFDTTGTSINGTYVAADGTLTLSGSGTAAQYQHVLRSVRYANANEAPVEGLRAVDVVASNARTSNVLRDDVAVAAVNDAPVVTASAGSVAYVEDGAASVVDAGVSITDVDGASLMSATVHVTVGGETTDALVCGACAGLSVSYVAGTQTLTISGSGSLAAYEAALRSVTFSTTSDTPSTTTRTITFTANDGGAVHAASGAVTRGVTVAAHDDAPVLDGLDNAVNGHTPIAQFTENGAPAVIDTSFATSDPDSTMLTGASACVCAGQDAGQELTADVTGTSIVAAWDGDDTLELSGSDTLAHYEQVLRTVAYTNSSDAIGVARATVEVHLASGVLASNTISDAVDVVSVNDAPVVTSSAGSAAYVEDGATSTVDPGLVVTDIDDAYLMTASVRVTGAGETTDRLACGACGGLTANYIAATQTLVISGVTSPAAYQAALRSVTFATTSDTPSTAARTVTFTVVDGDDQGVASRGVTVATHDDPAAVSGLSTTTYTEGDVPLPIGPSVTVTDPDSMFVSGWVGITGNWAAGQDDLAFTASGGIFGAYNGGSGLLSLTGTATPAQWQAVLRSVTYANSSNAPMTNPRGIDWQVTDGTNATTASSTINVVSVDSPPLLTGDTGSVNSNASLSVVSPGVLANDVDVDTALSVTTFDAVSSKGATVTVLSNGGYTYDPRGSSTLRALAPLATTTDTFTYVVGSGINARSATVTITVTGANTAPVATGEAYGVVGNTLLDVGGASAQPVLHRTGTLLGNDTDGDSDPLTAVLDSPAAHGTVALNTNGTFTYLPDAGYVGGDSFTYRANDGTDSSAAAATVTLTVANRVWYVRNTASAGGADGRSTKPFPTLAAAQAVSATGDRIFVERGDGTSTGQAAGITLPAGAQLLGQRAGLVVGGDTIFTASGAAPVLTSASGAVVTTQGGATVRGLALVSSSGAALSQTSGAAGTYDDLVITGGGSGVSINGSGAVTLTSIGVNVTGAGISLGAVSANFVSGVTVSAGTSALTTSGTTLAGTIASASSTSGGVSLTNTGGSLSVPAGTIRSLAVSSGTASFTYGGAITATSVASTPISISGSTTTLTGAINLSTTGATTAFTATGGTVAVTGSSNTITTATGTALNLNNATIGAAGVTFQSITSTGAGGGGTINLVSTGSGPLTVNGGSISNKSSDAVTLRSTGGLVKLSGMTISNIGPASDSSAPADTFSGADGIQGENVTGGLELSSVRITRISDKAVNGASFSDGFSPTTWNGLRITGSELDNTNRWFNSSGPADDGPGDEAAVSIHGVTGTVLVTGSNFHDASGGLDLQTATTGTLDLTVQSSYFTGLYKDLTGDLVGNYGIHVRHLGSTSSVIRIGDPNETNAALGNTFTNNRDGSILITDPTVGDSTGDTKVTVARNTMSVTDHLSAPSTPAFNGYPHGGTAFGQFGYGRTEAIFANNQTSELQGVLPMEVWGSNKSEGDVSFDNTGGSGELIVRNNTFTRPWNNAIAVYSGNTGNPTQVQVASNSYVSGPVGGAGTDLNPASQAPYWPSIFEASGVSSRLDLTVQHETQGVNDLVSGGVYPNGMRLLNNGGAFNLFLNDVRSANGYQFVNSAGAMNVFRNGSGSGTMAAVLADNQVLGGGGNANLSPPTTNVSGTVSLNSTAPTLPSITIP